MGSQYSGSTSSKIWSCKRPAWRTAAPLPTASPSTSSSACVRACVPGSACPLPACRPAWSSLTVSHPLPVDRPPSIHPSIAQVHVLLRPDRAGAAGGCAGPPAAVPRGKGRGKQKEHSGDRPGTDVVIHACVHVHTRACVPAMDRHGTDVTIHSCMHACVLADVAGEVRPQVPDRPELHVQAGERVRVKERESPRQKQGMKMTPKKARNTSR